MTRNLRSGFRLAVTTALAATALPLLAGQPSAAATPAGRAPAAAPASTGARLDPALSGALEGDVRVVVRHDRRRRAGAADGRGARRTGDA